MAIAKMGARNPNADASRLVTECEVFVVDAATDVASLPAGAAIGSLAIVIATGDKYIVNTSGSWVKFGTASN